MQITIVDQVIDIAGNPEDPYFISAESHAGDMSDLLVKLVLVPVGATIFDIGANIGLSTIAMAISRPDAKIYSFEPSPSNVVFLRQNTARFSNVTVIGAAISDKPGNLNFHASSFTAGSHVVGASHISEEIATTVVPALQLDQFVKEFNLSPSFIKIDVEGHEPEVLAGARETLGRVSPWVYMEFNTWTLNAYAGHSPSAFAAALFNTFEVEGWTDPHNFLHDNIVTRGCISDILIRLKPGASVPSLEEMSYSRAARDEIASIRSGNSAITL